MSKRVNIVALLFGEGRLRRLSIIAALAALAMAMAAVATLFRPPVEIALPGLRAAEPLRLQWFGSSEPAEQPSAALQPVNLRGELLGVLVAGSRSTATIKLQGKPEQVFRIGDELASGIRLVVVEHQRIVVEQRGQRRELPLLRDSLADSELQAVAGESAASDDSAAGVAMALSGLFRAQPVAQGDGRGLLLSDIGDEMAILTDLQSGDIVVAVQSNGERLTVDQLMANPALWSALALNSELPVTVVRDDSEMTLLINAASLAARVMPNLTDNQ